MRNSINIFLVLITMPMIGLSQIWDIGIWGGISNYQGEINPDFNMKFVKPAYGALIRYNFNPIISVRGNFSKGSIGASDSEFKGWQQQRNLSFQSKITELSGLFEFNFKPFITGDPKYNFTTYLFTGFSVFSFKPQTTYNGSVTNLQEFGTEGQGSEYYPDRNKYFLYNFAIPLGGGIKVSLSNHISFGLEIGARRTFTDYLDDVSTAYPNSELIGQKADGSTTTSLSNQSLQASNTNDIADHQRGNSKDKDWYMFGGAILAYNFKFGKCGKAFYEGYKWD